MKNRLFEIVNRIYLWIYCFVNGTVYHILSIKRTKKLPNLTKHEKEEVVEYWSKYKKITGCVHEYKWFKSKGKLDKRLIPEELWHADIEPHFNNVLLEKAFQDKNYYEMIVGKNHSPETIVHCINGQLLDENYLPIDCVEASQLINSEGEVICKASMGTSGGRGIKFISEYIEANDIEKIIELYDRNFLIQKIIKQHPLIESFNKTSVNTMRIITFLYKGKVHFIYGELRFGSAGARLDNSAAGGRWVLINKDGIIQNEFYIFDKSTTDMYVDKNYVSPIAENTSIPNWDEVILLLKQTHYKLAHFGIVYWDVSISQNGNPIILEYNLLDSDAYAYQYGVGPFFGDMTEQVLSEIYLQQKNSNPC